MADGNVKLNISVEPAVIDALKKFAQEVRNEFGIAIQDVSFDWREEMGGSQHLMSVDVRMKK